MKELLTDNNYLLYCAKYYLLDRYHSDEEFLEDINRIKYIKKLVTRYVENDDLRERLILNHIIILANCFGAPVLNKILYLKLKSQMQYVKPFLVLLNMLQDEIYNVGDEAVVYTDQISMDPTIVERLRSL